MTRDRAIEVFAETHNNHASGWAARWIDAFAELNMLKLDEPPNEAEEKFVEAVRSWPYGWTPRACLEDLKAKGLRIVEK